MNMMGAEWTDDQIVKLNPEFSFQSVFWHFGWTVGRASSR